MSNLKSQLSLLQESSLSIDDFYAINIFEFDIRIQGLYSEELYKKCLECNYTFEFNSNTQALEAKNEVITIILILR